MDMMNPVERRMLFTKGFGDGAKASAQKHPDLQDYMSGWHAGRKARGSAIVAYCIEHDLPLPSPLRTEEF